MVWPENTRLRIGGAAAGPFTPAVRICTMAADTRKSQLLGRLQPGADHHGNPLAPIIGIMGPTGSQWMSDCNDLVDVCALYGEDWVAAALTDGNVTGLGCLSPQCPLGWRSIRSAEGGLLPPARSARALVERLRKCRPDPLGSGIVPDRPDFCDRPFVPSLACPEPAMPVKGPMQIGEQGDAADCAAFALAALALTAGRDENSGLTVSVAMLDALAREHDEFMENTVEGTSLRGVLKGFLQNGVCRASICGAKVVEGEPFLPTRKMAKDARSGTLDPDRAPDPSKDIKFRDLKSRPRMGAQAALVTGYDNEGFIIQNSSGQEWGIFDGHPGHARWSMLTGWRMSLTRGWCGWRHHHLLALG